MDQKKDVASGTFSGLRLVDGCFALVIVFAAVTRWRFISYAVGAGEIAGALACLLVFGTRLRSRGLRGLWPGKWFAGAWGVFWFCGVAGSLTRRLISDAEPSGFWHNVLAVLFLTGLTWAFRLEYFPPEEMSADPVQTRPDGRARGMFALTAGLSVLFFVVPYLLTITGAAGEYFLFPTPQGPRFCGLATNPNQLALLAVVAFGLSAYLMHSGSGGGRWLWGLAALGQLAALWGTHSDIGRAMVPAVPVVLVGALLLCLFRRRVPGWGSFAFAAAVLAIGGAYLLAYRGLPMVWRVQQELRERMPSEKEEGNLKYRLKLLENACTVVERTPVWGAGFGAQMDYKLIFPAAPQGREAHNTPVDVTIASGVLGLLLFALIWARAVWNVWRRGNWVLLAGLSLLFLFGSFHNYMRHPAAWFLILFCLWWRGRLMESAGSVNGCAMRGGTTAGGLAEGEKNSGRGDSLAPSEEVR